MPSRGLPAASKNHVSTCFKINIDLVHRHWGMPYATFQFYIFLSSDVTVDVQTFIFFIYICLPKLMNLNYIFVSNFFILFIFFYFYILVSHSVRWSFWPLPLLLLLLLLMLMMACTCYTRLNYPLKLRTWHHACASWNGKTGEWQLWVKAERVGRGFHNRVSMRVV